ncbi:unnamed protein product [Owenia fusiformis]|uniref:Sulfotransferase n=1 Tax=Owenia fusiformis TaxID=6347 RepID=A0A8S4NT56_OWEFU|nr:unnamed protein product [Owenia fusiformis]
MAAIDLGAVTKEVQSVVDRYGKEYDFIAEGYETLAKCWAGDGQTTQAGLTMVRDISIFLRLKGLAGFLQAIKDDPKILEVPIKDPIFIAGFMRTGSTHLHNLLNEDEHNFSPPLWQVTFPIPIPESKDIPSDDPRFLRTAQFSERFNSIPGWLQKHQAFTPSALEECFPHIGKTGLMKEMLFAGQNMDDYITWYENINEEKMTKIYQYYKIELQLLAYKQAIGKTYIRKDSQHMGNMAVLKNVFPGAKIIHTIRDPIEVMGSVCSTMHTVTMGYYKPEDISLTALGQRMLRHASYVINKYMDYRMATDGPGKTQADLVDVYYPDMVDDSKGTMRKIYDKFGLELTQETLQNVEKYVAKNPINKHGKHSYKLATYGLTEDGVKNVFKRYIDYFNIQC